MSVVLRIDFETRSDVDLIGCGVYRYVESEHTDVLMASYNIDGPVRRWKRGEPCPADIVEHVRAGRPIKAWNAGFERMNWWRVLCVKHGWPKPALEQFHCSAVAAAAMSLPRSLDRCGEALDMPIKKSKAGSALIRFFSIPTGWRDGKPVFNEPEDHPQKFSEFQDYCDQDVLAEEAIDNRLVPLSDYEQKVYWLNERVNDRGLRIDVKSARAALEIVEKAKHHVNVELTMVTGGYVTAVSQAAALKRWVESRGIHIPSMAEQDVDEYLHEVDDLPADVRRVLELRQEGGKSSLAKIETMLKRAGRDGRVRGEYLHHGAGQTGRFSSNGVQVHNMPRYRKVFEDAKLELSPLFDGIRTGSPQWLVDSYGAELGRPLHILADAVRSFIWAAPGKVLLDADYASIEGRAAAWFAREDWKLKAYQELDAGHGYDMYKQAAAPIYNVPVAEVTKQQRQVGKVAELALGYNGGVGALSKMARMNKLKLGSVYQPVWESAPIKRRKAAMERLEERKEKNDPAVKELGDEAWISAELIKVGWRAANPKITAAWAELNDAAYAAVQNPGSVHRALFGKVAYLVDNGFLWCLLPSGRCLAYGSPRIDDVEAPWADKTQPKELRETKKTVTALGVNSQTKMWHRSSLYGGAYFNHVTQSSCRDILVHGMMSAEAAGYEIVLHTHDEMAVEIERDKADVAAFEKLICELPAWADGLPLTSSGWSGKRYRKD